MLKRKPLFKKLCYAYYAWKNLYQTNRIGVKFISCLFGVWMWSEWSQCFRFRREKLTSFVNGHLQDNLPMLQSRKQQPHFNNSAIVWKPFERVKIPSQRQNNPSKNHLCYFSTLSNFFLFFLLCLCWNARDFWKINHLWRASLTQSFCQRYTFNCKQKCSISNFQFPIWMFPKIVVPQNGWFIMKNLIKMDDLEKKTRFLETPISFSTLASKRHILQRLESLESEL